MGANRGNMPYHIKNQIQDADGDTAGVVLCREVRITSAEILALYTTAKELVAAPGVGKVLEFVAAVFFIDYGSATYASNGNLKVHLGTTGTAVSNQLDAADLVQKTADTYVRLPVKDDEETVLQDNENLELRCGTGNPDTGNSPIIVKVMYRIHDFT